MNLRKGSIGWLGPMLCPLLLHAQNNASSPATIKPDLKIFEAAITLTNNLTSWALVVIGGSILAILSTSYYRPKLLWFRCTYLLFLPAWIFVSLSLYSGTRVQGVYLAALFSAHPNLEMLQERLNSDSAAQIFRMEAGLVCLGIWLTLYLMWWIFNKE